MNWTILSMSASALAVGASMAFAQTEIQWWHAMGGTNGERVDKIASDFNASQSDYKVVPAYKGASWPLEAQRSRIRSGTGYRMACRAELIP